MAFLIRDGFTLEGLVPARPGLHGEVRFSYRPAIPERVGEYLKADASTAPKELANHVKLLLEHLVSWDVEENGQPVPLDAAALRRVPHGALQVLLNHVTGYTATDWGEREKN